jgi:hypothetical protein
MSKYYDFSSDLIPNTTKWKQRMAIGTAVTGLVRIEWVLARYGQIIPVNWSMADLMGWIPTVAPLHYIVSDAQNLIVRSVIAQDIEWLLLLEHDNVIPMNLFLTLNTYMRKATIPVISALYFTKSEPSEPLLFRDRYGTFFDKWKMGDKVWCDAVPTGCLLIHASILRAMWNESPEYKIGDQVTKRVFSEPAKCWFNPQRGTMENYVGTSDLNWCKRVMDEGFFEKAGWHKYQKMKYPFLVDTNIFVKHIDETGRQFPLAVPAEFKPEPKKKNAKHT